MWSYRTVKSSRLVGVGAEETWSLRLFIWKGLSMLASYEVIRWYFKAVSGYGKEKRREGQGTGGYINEMGTDGALN